MPKELGVKEIVDVFQPSDETSLLKKRVGVYCLTGCTSDLSTITSVMPMSACSDVRLPTHLTTKCLWVQALGACVCYRKAALGTQTFIFEHEVPSAMYFVN